MPVPWASTPGTSFLATWEDLATALAKAGFGLAYHKDDTQAGARWWQKINALTAGAPLRPLSPRLIFGENAADFGPNMETNFSRRSVCCISAVLSG